MAQHSAGAPHMHPHVRTPAVTSAIWASSSRGVGRFGQDINRRQLVVNTVVSRRTVGETSEVTVAMQTPLLCDIPSG